METSCKSYLGNANDESIFSKSIDWRTRLLPECTYLFLGRLDLHPKVLYEECIILALQRCSSRLYIGVEFDSLAEGVVENALGWLYSVATTISQGIRSSKFRTTIVCSVSFEEGSNPTQRIAKHASQIDGLCVLEKCSKTQKPMLHILQPSGGLSNSRVSLRADDSEVKSGYEPNSEEIKSSSTNTNKRNDTDTNCMVTYCDSQLVSKIVNELGFVASGLQPDSTPSRISIDMSKPNCSDLCMNEAKSAIANLSVSPSNVRENLLWPTVVLGGTFDRIHEGHSVLLTIATAHAQQRVVVGLSSGDLLSKKRHAHYVQPYALRHFLLEEAINLCSMRSIEIVVDPLYDVYGVAGSMPDIHCIVVSKETQKGGDMVNAYRVDRGLSTLNIIVGPLAETIDLPQMRLLSDISKTVTILTDPTFTHETTSYDDIYLPPSTQLEKTSSTSFREREFQEDSLRNNKLFNIWQSSVCAFSNLDSSERDSMIKKLWSCLVTSYSEPHRYYHNLRHIDELASEFSNCIALLGPPPEKCVITAHHQLVSRLIIPLIYLVIIFHDVVYDPKSGDNEEKSAMLWESFSKELSMPKDIISVVSTAILKTKRHDSEITLQEQTEQEALASLWCSIDSTLSSLSVKCIVETLQDALAIFQDADMSILARPTEMYLEYSFQIYGEYHHLGHEVYTKGRSAVLKSLLSRQNVFCSRLASRWEMAARRNIQRELEYLPKWAKSFEGEFVKSTVLSSK